MDQDHSTTTTTPLWQDSAAKRLVAALAYPVFYLLNRPSMRRFDEAIYDFALRCNGIAINFKGRHGLTAGEEKFLEAYLPKAGSGALFDVGANHGSYTRYLRALSPDAPIYAFEPHPRTFASLQAHAGGPGITLVNQAMGEAPGSMTLYDMAAEDGSTQASLSREAVEIFSKNVVEHEITCTTLDAFVAEHAIETIALLKIDTEGHDLGVLKGAKDTIASKRIRAIQFEFIPANIATRVTMRDFFEALPGYRLYRLCLNGQLTELRGYDVKRCEIYVTHNIVALPG